jgi:2-aminoadipate transaminase
VPIIEDECSAELRYRGSAIPSIKALAGADDPVFHIAGMGKAYIPGIRLGFIAPPVRRISDVVKMKSISDLHTAPLYQDAFARYLVSPAAAANLERVRNKYRDLLDVIAAELAEHLPEGSAFLKPDGGLNMWVTLPPNVDSVDLFLTALQHNVSILVGAHLFPDRAQQNAFRLSFGYPDKQAVTRGVRALARAAAELARPSSGRYGAVV